MDFISRPTWLAGSHSAALPASAPAPIVVKYVHAPTMSYVTPAPGETVVFSDPTPDPTLMATPAPTAAVAHTPAPTPVAPPDPWVDWGTTQDGFHQKWCMYPGSHVFPEDNPARTPTDNPATRAHVGGN
jgi:hypothetical protein